MNNNEKAEEWARYAEQSPTERGRIDGLMAALNESPQILDLVLRKLKLSTVRQVLEWAWAAEKADTKWMRRGRDENP